MQDDDGDGDDDIMSLLFCCALVLLWECNPQGLRIMVGKIVSILLGEIKLKNSP